MFSLEFLEQWRTFINQNPVLSGIVGLWGAGVITFLFRKIPSDIYNWLKRQISTEISVSSHGSPLLKYFKIWFQKTGWSKHSRVILLWLDDVCVTPCVRMSPGYGTSFFFYKWRLFKLTITRDQNKHFFEEYATIQAFTRNKQLIQDLFDEVKRQGQLEQEQIYRWKNDYWSSIQHNSLREFDSIILPVVQKKRIIDFIDQFTVDKDWYTKHGIPYRAGILLYGPPGTGKTSIVSAVAKYTNRKLYIVNLNNIHEGNINNVFGDIAPNSIILIEDIDRYKVTNKKSEDESYVPLQLGSLLNVIDGIGASESRILIATTNNIQNLDAALIRPGRFDIAENIGYLTQECFVEMMGRFYPDYTVTNNILNEQTPASLQVAALENRANPSAVEEMFCQTGQTPETHIKEYFQENSKPKIIHKQLKEFYA